MRTMTWFPSPRSRNTRVSSSVPAEAERVVVDDVEGGGGAKADIEDIDEEAAVENAEEVIDGEDGNDKKGFSQERK